MSYTLTHLSSDPGPHAPVTLLFQQQLWPGLPAPSSAQCLCTRPALLLLLLLLLVVHLDVSAGRAAPCFMV